MNKFFAVAALCGLLAIAQADLPVDDLCLTTLSSGGNGDPHFTGFRGQRFDFHGEPWKVFNLLSTRRMQLNALFAPDARFTDGATVMNEVGLRIRTSYSSNGETTLSVACSSPQGAKLAALHNGKKLEPVDFVSFGDDDLVYGTLSSQELSVATPEWKLAIRATQTRGLGCFLNVDVSFQPSVASFDEPLPTGILGLTVEGTSAAEVLSLLSSKDLTVANNDVLGLDYVDNTYLQSMEPHRLRRLQSFGIFSSEPVSAAIASKIGSAHTFQQGRKLLADADGCGCMDTDALNFDSLATSNAGTCIYSSDSGNEVQVRVEGSVETFDVNSFVNETATEMDISSDRIDVTSVGSGSVVVTMTIDEPRAENGEDGEVSASDAIAVLVSRGSSAYASFTVLNSFRMRTSTGVWWRASRAPLGGGPAVNPCRPVNPCNPGTCLGLTDTEHMCICPSGYVEMLGTCVSSPGSPGSFIPPWDRSGPILGPFPGSGGGGGSGCSSSSSGLSPETQSDLDALCDFDVSNIMNHCSQFDNEPYTGTVSEYETMYEYMIHARYRSACLPTFAARRRLQAESRDGGFFSSAFCRLICDERTMQFNTRCQDMCTDDGGSGSGGGSSGGSSWDDLSDGARNLWDSWSDLVTYHPPNPPRPNGPGAHGEPHLMDIFNKRFNVYEEGDFAYFNMAVNQNGTRRVELWQRHLFFGGSRYSAGYGYVVHIVDTEAAVDYKLTIQAQMDSDRNIVWFAANECADAEWYRRTESGNENIAITDFNGVPHVTLETNVETGSGFLTLGQGAVLVLTPWSLQSPSALHTTLGLFDDVGFEAADGLWGSKNDYSILGMTEYNVTGPGDWSPFYDTEGIFLSCVWDSRGAAFDTTGREPMADNTTLADICTQAEIDAAESCCETLGINATTSPFIWESCVFDVCALGNCSDIATGYNETMYVFGDLPGASVNFTDVINSVLTGASGSGGTGSGGSGSGGSGSGGSGGGGQPSNWVTSGGIPVDCSSDSSICVSYDNTMCINDGMGNTLCMCTAGSEQWNESTHQCSFGMAASVCIHAGIEVSWTRSRRT